MTLALGSRAQSSGARLIAYDSVGSTNAEALQLARDGECGPLWCVTTLQTAGKGRRNRAWIAPRGNLAASILETLSVPPAVAATLGFAAGLALEAALRQISVETSLRNGSSADFRLKWPNDLLANGSKLSGILLEAETINDHLAVVVGMGTNVVSAPEGTPYPATSLSALGIGVSAEDLFSALSDSWVEYMGIWNSGKGFADIRRLWLHRAAGLGEPVSVHAGGGVREGIFETIDDTGCLILMTRDGQRHAVTAGDVHFGNAKSAGVA
jgi:BirA family biotin operon repressor/biotin-[acetyl-CoA-carboxylase] ligase